jgi:hypothetical protein
MDSRMAISCLLIAAYFPAVFGTGRFISGNFPNENQIIDGVQYIRKGAPYLDLEKAPVIAEIDPSDHSITLFVPSIAPPESLYIRFIPGNLFDAKISTEVIWNEQSKTYHYYYTIISDTTSVSAIRYFDIVWWNDYRQIYKPDGWSARPIYSRRVNVWSTFTDKTIDGGDTLSGIGYETYGPPIITRYELWGQTKDLGMKGSDEMFGSIYSGIMDKYRGVKGYTIAAWVDPESIEPVSWFGSICFKTPILKSSGYLDQQTRDAIYPTLYDLWEIFQIKENQTTEKLEQQINAALAALAPYQNQMEPEAWAFITENLKYVLRHLDIVQFKEYP